jgi:hypothetical protein
VVFVCARNARDVAVKDNAIFSLATGGYKNDCNAALSSLLWPNPAATASA